MSSDERLADRMSRRVLRGFEPDRLKSVRTKMDDGTGWSPADLARMAGISTATIYQWESGRRTPQIDVLAVVAKALGQPISEFVRIPEDKRFPADWRVLSGLTQPALGRLAGIPTVLVGRIERAETPLTDPVVARISTHLGISVEQYRAAYERARCRPPGEPA